MTDFAVYLVTDSTLVPENRTFLHQVEQSINNGATVVQLREKELSTRDFIARAEEVHALTKARGIPLIINDRVDVALAVDAEGVHVGQDDMDVATVRRLIGKDKILGLSVSNVEEARIAIENKRVVDYVGIGAVFDTSTKKLKKVPCGMSGVREVLQVLHSEGGSDIQTVAIGGLNEKNVVPVLYTASVPGKALDGVAVVSAIMASQDAGESTRVLAQRVREGAKNFPTITTREGRPSAEAIVNTSSIVPLTHQITNSVVKNFSANVTLAIGASPIMSESIPDFPSLAKVPHAGLLVNAGTVSSFDDFGLYSSAVSAYNNQYKPIVFDPVAAGASGFRKKMTTAVLNTGYLTVIKGNQAEILTLAGVENIEMKGVDSGEDYAEEVVINGAKKLALATRSIVVVTGKDDIVVEGNLSGSNFIPDNVKQKGVIIQGGHPLMGRVTGSGCSLGSVLTAYLAANPSNPFEAVVTAVSLYKHAGGLAGNMSEDKGPGSFMSLFVDELYKASNQASPESWNIMYRDI